MTTPKTLGPEDREYLGGLAAIIHAARVQALELAAHSRAIKSGSPLQVPDMVSSVDMAAGLMRLVDQRLPPKERPHQVKGKL